MNIETIQRLVTEKIPLAGFMGLQVEFAEAKHVRLCLPFSPSVHNHLDIMYAGAIFSLAEIAGGVLMLSTFDSEQYTVLIRRIEIDYVRPSRRDLFCDVFLDETIVNHAKSDLRQQGHADIAFPIEVTDPRERTMAKIQAFYYLRQV